MQESLNVGQRLAALSLAHVANREIRRAIGLVLLIGFAVTLLAMPAIAEEPSLRSDRVYWQDRYRNLVAEADRLREIVARERELYADANRRNYRRGRKRHVHRDAAAEAAAALAKVEAHLATIEDDARRAGAERGWLNQVEMELGDDRQRPAVGTGPGDEGRNPLHLKSTRSESSDDRDPSQADRNAGRNPLYLNRGDESDRDRKR